MKSIKIEHHPHRHKLSERLEALGDDFEHPFKGELFRFINPAYSKSENILSGVGALHASGRWHLKGLARTSYATMKPETALAEALAHVHYFRLPLNMALPRVLVALRLKVRRMLDLRKGDIRQHLRLSERTIREVDWRALNQKRQEAITQAWGWAISTAGYEGLIVPSAADHQGANVVIFPENMVEGSEFEVVDEVIWPE